MSVYEWLSHYAWADDNGKVSLPTLLHDFLKDSRVCFNKFIEGDSDQVMNVLMLICIFAIGFGIACMAGAIDED